MKLERLLSITIKLLNNERVSAKELAEKFGVSIRTIYRDVDTINSAGIPIVSYQGNNGGFGIIDTFKLDKHIFTDNDISSVLSALKGISRTLGDDKLDLALEKLVNIGLSRNKADGANMDEKVIIDFMPMGYTERQKAALKVIYYAISNNLLIDFDYTNAQGSATSRTVEPITLVFKTYVWYLFAYCRLKQDFRFFKLSRMSSLNAQVQKFEPRAVKYTDYEIDIHAPIKVVQMKLKFSKNVKTRVEDYFQNEAIEHCADGSLIVEVEWREDEWVYSHILSYGADVEVISPIELREIIKEKAKNICKLYQT